MVYKRKHEKIRSTSKWTGKEKPKKPKAKKVTQKLIDRVARVFQHWIRLRDTDENWYWLCCTCSTKVKHDEADAGHFLSRRHKNTIFNEQNVSLQCKKCNSPWWWSGEQYKHSIYIDNKYGKWTANQLLMLAQSIKVFTYEELIEIDKDYKERIKLLPKL